MPCASRSVQGLPLTALARRSRIAGMALDYVIDYDCAPKRALGTAGILERLKARERATAIIRLYRRSGDRPLPARDGLRDGARGRRRQRGDANRRRAASAGQRRRARPAGRALRGLPRQPHECALRLHGPHRLPDLAQSRGLPAGASARPAIGAAGLAAAETGHPRLQLRRRGRAAPARGQTATSSWRSTRCAATWASCRSIPTRSSR